MGNWIAEQTSANLNRTACVAQPPQASHLAYHDTPLNRGNEVIDKPLRLARVMAIVPGTSLQTGKSMAKQFSVAVAAVSVLVLVACGGGGGSTTPTATVSTDLVSKYVGKWSTGCNGPATLGSGAVTSSKQTVTIVKLSDTSYSAAGGSVDYVGAGCTGTGTPVAGETGTLVFTIAGTKTASGTATVGGSGEVDKVTYAASATVTSKDIIYVNAGGPTLQRGNTSGAKDADGFPDALLLQRYAKE